MKFEISTNPQIFYTCESRYLSFKLQKGNSVFDKKMKNNNNIIIVEAGKLRFKSYHIAAVFLIALATATFYLTGTHNNAHILEVEEQQLQQELQTTSYVDDADSSCNLFSGKWVYDDVSYPMYEEGRCSFMRYEFAREQHACQLHGRKDVRYQSWRWQPHDCDLPRLIFMID